MQIADDNQELDEHVDEMITMRLLFEDVDGEANCLGGYKCIQEMDTFERYLGNKAKRTNTFLWVRLSGEKREKVR